jgi:alanine racemase
MASSSKHQIHLPHESLRYGVRPTRVNIDLDVIEANLGIVKRSLTPNTLVIAVVKANAYGHGAAFVAPAAIRAGASMLAVATVTEGIVLRREGVQSPILVLGPIDPSQYRSAVEHSLTLSIMDVGMVQPLDDIAEESGRTAHVHLKIDTGMHRYGCEPADAARIATAIAERRHLWLEGAFTHFAEADGEDEASALAQAERFDAALEEIAAAGVPVQMRHVANSAAALRSRRFDYDAIRLGIALYGLPPSSDVPLLSGMRPALTLTSRIARRIPLEPGDGVSYGGTYVAKERETAVLIPCGYADGYRRALSNRGWLAAGDLTLPVRGRVCMDQLVAGIPDGADLDVGDEVTLMGTGDDAAPTVVQLAEMLDTIPYEVVSTLSQRIPRLHFRHGECIGFEELTGIRKLEPTGRPTHTH